MSMVDLKVPQAGESVSEVIIADWLKEDGDYVEMDELVCELESDKATLELPAEQAGQLKIEVEAGEEVEIGQVIGKIDTDASPPDKEKGEKGEDAKQEKEKVAASSAQKEKASSSSEEKYTTQHASPAAAKLMREEGLEPNNIEGTGKDGRIIKQDVKDALKKQNGQDKTTTEKAPPSPKKEEEKEEEEEKEPVSETSSPSDADLSSLLEPEGDFSRETQRERMSSLRKTVARHLVSAKNETAMLTTFNEIDMSKVIEARNKYKEKFEEKHGVRLGFMSFFTKACCVALKAFPQVNALIDGDELVYHDFCDIGIAVATPKGLVVPVIRNAESLSIPQVEAKVRDYAKRGQENKIKLNEMEGGTFTITNGGVFGSLISTPILNAPQSAILGMHKIEERPVAIDGEVKVRPMMYVALSYDHQVIDGQISVRFLAKIKEMIENPEYLLTGGDPVQKLLEL